LWKIGILGAASNEIQDFKLVIWCRRGEFGIIWEFRAFPTLFVQAVSRRGGLKNQITARKTDFAVPGLCLYWVCGSHQRRTLPCITVLGELLRRGIVYGDQNLLPRIEVLEDSMRPKASRIDLRTRAMDLVSRPAA
jgi:hypothetical protein